MTKHTKRDGVWSTALKLAREKVGESRWRQRFSAADVRERMDDPASKQTTRHVLATMADLGELDRARSQGKYEPTEAMEASGETDVLESRVERLEDQRDELQKERDALKEEAQQLQNAIENSEHVGDGEEAEALKEKVESLEGRLEDVEERNERLREERDDLAVEVEQLEAKLREQRQPSIDESPEDTTGDRERGREPRPEDAPGDVQEEDTADLEGADRLADLDADELWELASEIADEQDWARTGVLEERLAAAQSALIMLRDDGGPLSATDFKDRLHPQMAWEKPDGEAISPDAWWRKTARRGLQGAVERDLATYRTGHHDYLDGSE